MIRIVLCCGLLLWLSMPAHAQEDALTVEQRVPQNVALAFPNDQQLAPQISDFEVVNFVPMSNEVGERWAVVTLKNQASGRRTFNQTQIMALVGDGDRIHPNAISQVFEAKETLSIVVNFGVNKFPLLSVYTRLKA